MSHNIFADDKMAYRLSGGKTWHGLGTPVGDDVSDEEFFKISGLAGYTVCRRPILVEGNHSNILAVGYKALVRSTDGKVLGIGTDDYNPVQPAQIWKFFQQFCDTGNMTMETAGSLCGGTKVWALAKIAGATFDVNTKSTNGQKDRTDMYAMFSTGFKPGYATQVDITAIRAQCDNTVSMARNMGSDYRFKLTHRAVWNRHQEAKARAVVDNAMTAMDIYANHAQRMADTPVDRSIETAYLIELLQPEILRSVLDGKKQTLTEMAVSREAELGAGVMDAIINDTPEVHADQGKVILDTLVEFAGTSAGRRQLSPTTRKVRQLISNQPGAALTDGTLWGTFNAVTNYVDHHRGRTAASAVDSAFFGEGSMLKSKALDLAVEYTNRLSSSSSAR